MKILIFLFLTLSLLFSSTLHDEILQGVRLYKTKHYEEALEIFDRLLIEHPNNKRIRLEYARVLLALKMYDESKAQFIKVLNTNPPPIVQKNIKYFIKLIEKKKKTNFFKGSISIGATRDSNIENKSNNPVYGGFVDSNPTKRKDNFSTAEFSLFHIKNLPNAKWINSFYLYDEQNHQKSEDKVTFLNLATMYQVPLFGLRMSIPLSYSLTLLTSKKYSDLVSFQPKLEYLTQTSVISGAFIFEKSKNFSDTEKSYRSYGVRAKYLWMLKKFTNSAGLELKKFKKTTGNRLDISKDRVSMDISSSYPLFETNLVNMFYKNTHDIYKEKDPTIKEKRKDKIDNFTISLQQEITRKKYFELSFTKIKNKSNLDFYSYKKSLFSLKLTKEF